MIETATATASAVFPNIHAAKRAAERLARGGFARDSIEVTRLYSNDDAHEVCVHTKKGNLRRADDLLHARNKVHDFPSNAIDVTPLLLVGGAIAAGALTYTMYALRRNRGAGRSDLHLPSVW